MQAQRYTFFPNILYSIVYIIWKAIISLRSWIYWVATFCYILKWDAWDAARSGSRVIYFAWMENFALVCSSRAKLMENGLWKLYLLITNLSKNIKNYFKMTNIVHLGPKTLKNWNVARLYTKDPVKFYDPK